MKRRSTHMALASLAAAVILSGFGGQAHAADLVPTPLPVPEPTAPSPTGPEAAAETALSVSTTTSLPTLQTNGAAAISKRQATLTALSQKIGAATKDCGTNALMLAEIGRTSASLQAVGFALASTTDVATARVLYRQIFTEHRVYALVDPKAGVVQRCVAQLQRNDALAAEAAKLQALIDKAKADGVNTTVAQVAKDSAMATLATVNPVPSQATVIYLVPDRGDKALLSANTAALKAANQQLNATLALQRTVNLQLDAVRAALRQDVKKGKRVAATAPTTTQPVAPVTQVPTTSPSAA